jgi:hypothetical protein
VSSTTVDASTWFQTTEQQFDTNTLTNTVASTSDAVEVISSGIVPSTGVDGSVTLSSLANINTDVIGSLRSTNADGIATLVTSFDAATGGAEINVDDTTGFGIGDEVLLINLRGDASNNSNAGNYELLRIESVSANTITFTSEIQNIYGATVDNGNLSGQAVRLQRIPQWTTVTINSGGTLTADDWAGSTGGIVAFRADSVTINPGGALRADGLG